MRATQPTAEATNGAAPTGTATPTPAAPTVKPHAQPRPARPRATRKPTVKPIIEPELLRAESAAHFCGCEIRTWWRHNTFGRCPAPVKLNGKPYWSRTELLSWIAAGCPERREWEAIVAEREGATARTNPGNKRSGRR